MSVESHGVDLLPAVALLAAGVVAVPIFKRIGLGSVIGYLVAGIAIGPFGLGLFTAAGIVRGHGGRIAAANRSDGKGARFTVEVPLVDPMLQEVSA